MSSKPTVFNQKIRTFVNTSFEKTDYPRFFWEEKSSAKNLVRFAQSKDNIFKHRVFKFERVPLGGSGRRPKLLCYVWITPFAANIVFYT